MTEEQYKTARKIQSDISDYNERVNKLQDVIKRLSELGEQSSVSDIVIRLNEQWCYTPKGSVDYDDLLNFLYEQRDKFIKKIADAEKEFAEL